MVLAIAQLIRLLVVPIGKEALVWWEMRESASTRQLRHTGIGLLIVLLLIVVPIDNELELPAYWQAQGVVTLYAPIAGRVQQLPAAYESRVSAGETVVVISSPDLRFELDQASHDVKASKYQLERTSVNMGLAQDRLSLQAQLRGALAKRVDIKALLADANLVSPFDASITSIQPDLRIGDWVSKGDNLLTLVDDRGGEIVAYISESELGALGDGARGRFYPEGGTRPPFDVELVEVESFALEQLEQIYVASRFGGSLDVRDGKDGALIPQRATYRIHMQTEHANRDRVLRGQLVLEAKGRSLLSLFWRQAVGIWRREAGV